MIPPLCLQFLSFDVIDLMASHPPRWKHPHKQAVYDRLLQETDPPTGSLHYTRWAALEPAGPLVLHPCEIATGSAFYTYPSSSRSAVVWHVNFADPRLFAAYGSPLLAQDELQALEHPSLGSLREALLAAEHPALTRENGRSTPVLITGVPRQGALNIRPADPGPKVTASLWARLFQPTPPPPSPGLYGNHFQKASLAEIQAAFTVLRPPPLTHLIAIAAPTGSGRYTRKQIVDILETACTAFAAALIESHRLEPLASTEVHTGWWGCGAFGGQRSLMALLQILAATLTGIHRLTFHTGSLAETPAFEEGRALLESLLSESPATLADLVDAIEGLGYTWGSSDGN